MNNYYCIMDVVIYAMRPINYTIFQVVPLLLLGLWAFRHDFNYPVLLHKGSWRAVWKSQIKRMLLMTNISAVLFLGMIGVCSYYLPLYNWNQYESYFYLKNEVLLTESAIEIAICVYVVCLIRNILIQSSILLSLWLKNSIVPGILTMCCVCAIEITQVRIRVFYWVFSVDYTMWITAMGRGILLVAAVGYLCVLYAAFSVCMKYKEFLNEKDGG